MELSTNDQKGKYHLQSVSNALRIIELLGEFNFLTLSEIADKLELGKSSVFRLVATLESRGFVKKDKYGRCRLGMKFSYLGSIVLARMEVLQSARPFLEELQRQVREIVRLAVWDDDCGIRYIDHVDGALAFHMNSFVGLPRPFHSTAAGKAMLAYMDENFIDNFLAAADLTPVTSGTITDADRLREELEAVRKDGYSLSVEEDETGLTSIAAPVMDYGDRPIAAVCISGPSGRISKQVSEYAKKVMEAAERVSMSLR